MKTIQLIAACIDNMKSINLPADIQIGSFKVTSSGHLINWAGTCGQYEGSKISFNIKFRPDHIQHLLELGVKINLNEAVMADLSPKALRFKSGRAAIKQGRYAPYYYMGNPDNAQTGVIENWLIAPARCSLATLQMLDRYCRDNHRSEIAINNNTCLAAEGWPFKQQYAQAPSICLMSNAIAKKVRRNVADKKKNLSTLHPVERRAIDQKKFEV